MIRKLMTAAIHCARDTRAGGGGSHFSKGVQAPVSACTSKAPNFLSSKIAQKSRKLEVRNACDFGLEPISKLLSGVDRL